MKTRVLLVDDDAAVAQLVAAAFGKAGHAVRCAGSVDEAVLSLKESPADVLLLDIQLPGLSGLQFLEILKKDPATASLPVIMLTSRAEERSRVAGLKGGADDYVVKPFSMAELLARVEALLRRARHGGRSAPVLEGGGIRLEEDAREVTVNGRGVDLTAMEFRLLSILMGRPGHVFALDALTGEMSEKGKEMVSDTLYAHVRNLRRKLGPAGGAVSSVHGVGYKFSA